MNNNSKTERNEAYQAKRKKRKKKTDNKKVREKKREQLRHKKKYAHGKETWRNANSLQSYVANRNK